MIGVGVGKWSHMCVEDTLFVHLLQLPNCEGCRSRLFCHFCLVFFFFFAREMDKKVHVQRMLCRTYGWGHTVIIRPRRIRCFFVFFSYRTHGLGPQKARDTWTGGDEQLFPSPKHTPRHVAAVALQVRRGAQTCIQTRNHRSQ